MQGLARGHGVMCRAYTLVMATSIGDQDVCSWGSVKKRPSDRRRGHLERERERERLSLFADTYK